MAFSIKHFILFVNEKMKFFYQMFMIPKPQRSWLVIG